MRAIDRGPQGGAKGQPGFTLVEALIVIAIIVLLIALLMPVLRRAKERARRVICAGQLEQIFVASSNYAFDNNSRFFRHRNSTNGASPPSALWNPSAAQYVLEEKRVTNPRSGTFWPIYPSSYSGGLDSPTSSDLQSEGNSFFAQMGGPKGGGSFYDGLYPNYIIDGRVFTCPSVHNFGFQNAAANGWLDNTFFDKSGMAEYYRTSPRGVSGSQVFLSSYHGSIFGKIDAPPRQRGNLLYSAYFTFGAYPWGIGGFAPRWYVQQKLSPVGSFLSDVGCWEFDFGPTDRSTWLGNHQYGVNDCYSDGSVRWRKYWWGVYAHLSRWGEPPVYAQNGPWPALNEPEPGIVD